MNKVCQVVLGAVAFAAVSVGVVGEAKAVNPDQLDRFILSCNLPGDCNK